MTRKWKQYVFLCPFLFPIPFLSHICFPSPFLSPIRFPSPFLSHSFLLLLPFLFLLFLTPSHFPSQLSLVRLLIHLFLFILICASILFPYQVTALEFCLIPFHSASVFYLTVNAIRSPYFFFIFADCL